jgi:glycosyltransferase involved in cell wall biosynthesis
MNGSGKASQIRVAVLGTWNWLEVAADLLRCANIPCDVIDIRSLPRLAGWAIRGNLRRYDFVYRVGGSCWSLGLLFKLLGRKVVWHWIGSDVLGFRSDRQRRGVRGWIGRRAAYRWAFAHLADSPQLAQELQELGLSPQVVRLLPKCIEASPQPLPEKFTVLSYWTKGRRTFYGGDIVFALAQAMPEVAFLVVGTEAADEPAAPANVKCLGYLKDLSPIYSRSSVLVRLPQHDSLSAMVLEMLARGRYVIYNKNLPGCHQAGDFDGALRALKEIRDRGQINAAGSEMVKQDFSREKEARTLSRLLNGC